MADLQTQYIFYYTHLNGVKRQLSSGSPSVSQEPTSSYSSGTTDFEDTRPFGYNTQISSDPSDELINPALSPVETWSGDRLIGSTVADDPLEATPDTPHKSQGALQDSFSIVSVIEERSATSTPNFMDIYVPFQEKPADQVSEVAKARIMHHHTGNGEEFISKIPLQGNRDDEYRDRPLPLDQEGTEFEVEILVAKGRIGRRVWYKVKKKDIGTGATANYEERHSHGRSEFKFEQLVSKQEVDGIILYEAKWQGQPETENIWVDKWDLSAKVVAAFEAGLST